VTVDQINPQAKQPSSEANDQHFRNDQEGAIFCNVCLELHQVKP
jgi:hypothetical protein